MKRTTLPLGIDIGTTRVRIVEACLTRKGPRVRGVAVREYSAGAGGSEQPQFVATLIEDARTELRTRERRCVAAVGAPDATLHPLSLPKMSASERERAARFEARRFLNYDVRDAVIALHGTDRQMRRWTLGIARSSTLSTRLAALRLAGLKTVAIDHESCALTRALPEYDAILDIGFSRSSLHVAGTDGPQTWHALAGGTDLTKAIERDLRVDEKTAEKRKRIVGTAGAGERARSVLVTALADLVEAARARKSVARIALVGNGARLCGLASEIERATGAICCVPVSRLLNGSYPEDVIRAGAADWNLAAGLTAWIRT